MQQQPSVKDQRDESMLFRRRAKQGFALIMLSLIVLLACYVYLQVFRHDEFSMRSVNNRVKPRVIPPPRGLIYDRHGVLLANNVPAFRLEVVPERIRHLKAMLARLNKVVPLDQDDIDHFLDRVKKGQPFDSIPLRFHLTEKEMDRFAVNRWRFPNVDVVPYLTRHYPLGNMFAHVVGYVGRINASDLKNINDANYNDTTYVGRTGIERSYESVLHGTPGYELDEVNASGRVQRVLQIHPSTPGNNLYLSIDARIQQAAEKAFKDRAGAAVAIDPRNGQVLAMVSVPSFQPNLFVRGINARDYQALLNDADKPLFNRALRGIYLPGSTVKPLLALGGLEMGLRTPEDTCISTGVFHVPGWKRDYRDDRRGGFGKVNMRQAIMLSVNTYFYKLALDMGINRLSRWMARFGLGQPTGIDLDNEASGVLPSRAWKAAHSRNPWYPGETVIAGIGQGYWAVTPLQLTYAMATFASHGVSYAPHLVIAAQKGQHGPRKPLVVLPAGSELSIRPASWQVVVDSMRSVMSDAQGTGYRLGKGFPYAIAGKSGTAERYSRRTRTYNTDTNRAYLASRHRAWFIMFTPAQHPRIVVTVLLESGAWGASAAGPIAREILDAWLTTHPPPLDSKVARVVPVRTATAGSNP